MYKCTQQALEHQEQNKECDQFKRTTREYNIIARFELS